MQELNKDLNVFSVEEFTTICDGKLKDDVTALILKEQEDSIRECSVVFEDFTLNVNLDVEDFGDYAKQLIAEDSEYFNNYLSRCISQKMNLDKLVETVECKVKRGIISKKDFSFFVISYVLRIQNYEKLEDNNYKLNLFMKFDWRVVDIDEI